ncbi:MAG: hypothetical protein AAF849_19700 [Bacteroidota bacterium]
MRITILLFFLFNSLIVFSQVNTNILNYNLSEGFDEKVESLQAWMKDKKVDIAAFQGVQETQEDLEKAAKKWKHKNVAILKGENNHIALTSKHPIKVVASEAFLKASIKDIQLYVVQVNQDSFKHRQAMIETLAEDIEQQLADNKKVMLLGQIEGYAKADSAIYSQRFREVPIKDRANREVIRQIASYARSRNYELLTRLTTAGLLDPVGMMREGEIIESTFPSKKAADVPDYRTYRTDYVLISPNLKSEYQKASVLKDDFTQKFSEHYPILVEIEMEK